jgi:hypothetical protein
VTLFELPFATAMGDRDVALLAGTLDLSADIHPASHNSPGVARLDHHSGLFLKRGSTEGQWMLQARTWGHPPPQRVHEWHVLAAGAAHLLDPTVTPPERLAARPSGIPQRPVGRAQNKRLARIRRHLVGLE